MTMSQCIALRKRKREVETEKYINSDFILGSVAASVVVGEERAERQQEEYDAPSL